MPNNFPSITQPCVFFAVLENWQRLDPNPNFSQGKVQALIDLGGDEIQSIAQEDPSSWLLVN